MSPHSHKDPRGLVGNPNQVAGKHRDRSSSTCGIGLIPHGHRDRCLIEYEIGVDVVEDRWSDPNVRRI